MSSQKSLEVAGCDRCGQEVLIYDLVHLETPKGEADMCLSCYRISERLGELPEDYGYE